MNQMYIILLISAVALVMTHVLPSMPRIRSRIVATVGEAVFSGIYSLVAIACIAIMVWAFNRVPQDFIWVPGPGVRHLPALLMPLALLLVVTGLLTPNPATYGKERQLQAQIPAIGIVRVTRHPFLWGVILWSIAHILANGDVGALIFFGGFFGLSVAGMIGLDRKRAVKYGEAWQRFVDVTSSVPFFAIIRGRNKLIISEIGWLKLVATIVVYVTLLFGHRLLFGVSPL